MAKFREVQVEKVIWNNDTEFSGSYNELRDKPESGCGLSYEKVEVEIIAGESTLASYSGTPDGCATPVVIAANSAGSAGNLYFDFDGINTINTVISGFPVTLKSGDGTQIPAYKSSIILTGGTDALPSSFEVEHTLNTKLVRVTISGPDFITNIGEIGICQLSYSDGGKLYADTTKNGPFISDITTSGFTVNIGTLVYVTTFIAGTYTILIEKIN